MEAGAGWALVKEPEDVGLVDLVHLKAGMKVEFVVGAGPHPGDEAVPDARLAPGHQGVGGLIPVVEVADDEDLFGIRGPDREVSARHAVQGYGVGPQLVVQPEMAALVKQINIFITEH